MAKSNFSFHFTFTPRDDSCLMEACVSRLLYYSGPSWGFVTEFWMLSCFFSWHTLLIKNWSALCRSFPSHAPTFPLSSRPKTQCVSFQNGASSEVYTRMHTISRKCKKNAYKTFLPFSPKAHDKGVNWVGQVMNSQYMYIHMVQNQGLGH